MLFMLAFKQAILQYNEVMSLVSKNFDIEYICTVLIADMIVHNLSGSYIH